MKYLISNLLYDHLSSLTVNRNDYDTCRSSDRYVVRSSYLVSESLTQDVSYSYHLASSTLYRYNTLTTVSLDSLVLYSLGSVSVILTLEKSQMRMNI